MKASKIIKTTLFVGLISVLNTANAQQKTPGINVDLMDKSVKPGDDFFRYVNGTWFDRTEIPGDRVRWGSFDELRQNTDIDALAILKEATANKKLDPNSDQAKAVNVFVTYMDTVSRNKLGIKPIKPTLDKINAIKNVDDLNKLILELQPEGGIGFYSMYIGADAKNSTKNIVNITLGSLGLPDRDYYVSDDADSKEKREKYVLHVEKMLQYVGEKPAQAKESAKKVLALETAMATPRLDRVERRDRRKTYNMMSVADLQKLTPAVNWNNYFTKLGITKLDSLNVSQPKYMTALQTIFTGNKVEDWKAYLRWMLIDNASDVLTTEIEKANWDFYSQTLQGAKKQRPREERALQVVNGTVGEALGKLYVEKKFPAEAKEKANKMIKNVFLAFENRINKLPWMTPETRKGAIEKLKKSTVKIGYPDKWKDYSKLTINSQADGGTLYKNLQNVTAWQYGKELEKVGKPVDRTEWGMTPQTVNAYYNPVNNEIVFPAAILQPPFFNPNADPAINFGGIGAVIGHEITHGFDDSGAQFDADGNLVDWWTPEDKANFEKATKALAAQYDKYEPVKGTFVNGTFTNGENIADLGGVNIAYDALQMYLKDHGNPGEISGYTQDQRFFMSWATVWRTLQKEAALVNQIKTDSHSPGLYRAFGPLINTDAFYKAFNVKEGDKLYKKPEDRVIIW